MGGIILLIKQLYHFCRHIVYIQIRKDASGIVFHELRHSFSLTEADNRRIVVWAGEEGKVTVGMG
jgi:hypothetical protein